MKSPFLVIHDHPLVHTASLDHEKVKLLPKATQIVPIRTGTATRNLTALLAEDTRVRHGSPCHLCEELLGVDNEEKDKIDKKIISR